MKTLLIIAVLIGAMVASYHYVPMLFVANPAAPGIKMGQTVEEVEQIMGPALSVVPNFGNELRVYEGQSGNKYMFIFKNGELVEIQH